MQIDIIQHVSFPIQLIQSQNDIILTSCASTRIQIDVGLTHMMVVSRLLEQLYHQMLLHGVHGSSVLAVFLLTLFIFRQSWVVYDIQTEISQFPQAHIWCLYALYTVISWSILIEITNHAYEINWYYYKIFYLHQTKIYYPKLENWIQVFRIDFIGFLVLLVTGRGDLRKKLGEGALIKYLRGFYNSFLK